MRRSLGGLFRRGREPLQNRGPLKGKGDRLAPVGLEGQVDQGPYMFPGQKSGVVRSIARKIALAAAVFTGSLSLPGCEADPLETPPVVRTQTHEDSPPQPEQNPPFTSRENDNQRGDDAETPDANNQDIEGPADASADMEEPEIPDAGTQTPDANSELESDGAPEPSDPDATPEPEPSEPDSAPPVEPEDAGVDAEVGHQRDPDDNPNIPGAPEGPPPAQVNISFKPYDPDMLAEIQDRGLDAPPSSSVRHPGTPNENGDVNWTPLFTVKIESKNVGARLIGQFDLTLPELGLVEVLEEIEMILEGVRFVGEFSHMGAFGAVYSFKPVAEGQGLAPHYPWLDQDSSVAGTLLAKVKGFSADSPSIFRPSDARVYAAFRSPFFGGVLLQLLDAEIDGKRPKQSDPVLDLSQFRVSLGTRTMFISCPGRDDCEWSDVFQPGMKVSVLGPAQREIVTATATRVRPGELQLVWDLDGPNNALLRPENVRHLVIGTPILEVDTRNAAVGNVMPLELEVFGENYKRGDIVTLPNNQGVQKLVVSSVENIQGRDPMELPRQKILVVSEDGEAWVQLPNEGAMVSLPWPAVADSGADSVVVNPGFLKIDDLNQAEEPLIGSVVETPAGQSYRVLSAFDSECLGSGCKFIRLTFAANDLDFGEGPVALSTIDQDGEVRIIKNYNIGTYGASFEAGEEPGTFRIRLVNAFDPQAFLASHGRSKQAVKFWVDLDGGRFRELYGMITENIEGGFIIKLTPESQARFPAENLGTGVLSPSAFAVVDGETVVVLQDPRVPVELEGSQRVFVVSRLDRPWQVPARFIFDPIQPAGSWRVLSPTRDTAAGCWPYSLYKEYYNALIVTSIETDGIAERFQCWNAASAGMVWP